jgi:tetratricopeptide (TPR) repeat protein
MLGRHLAAAGMTNDALTWFTSAVNVAIPSRSLTAEMMVDYAAASFLADRLDQSQQAFDQLLKFNPSDYSSLMVRSLIELRRDKPLPAKEFRSQARNSLVNRLNTIRNAMGIQGAATRPIDQGDIRMPELGGDTEAYRKQASLDEAKRVPDALPLSAAYLHTVADLAWFQVFFNDQSDEAQRLMRHAESLLDPKEQAAATFLPRMAGWVFLKQGKFDEARVKLAAVADRDPMAALGLIKCYGAAEKDKARIEAQKLVNTKPDGIEGAVLLDRLREFGVRAQPTESAPAMVAALSTLPPNWMSVLENPAAFYTIRGQPLRSPSQFGDPLIAQIVIQNISNVDLSVGSDGLIKPGVWFDAQIRGVFEQNIPAVAFERISDAIVLKPRQSVTLNVRADQGNLLRLLQQRPSAAINFKLIARTNPVFGGGLVVSGPGGYFIEIPQPFERLAFQISTDNIQSLGRKVVSADGRERVRQLQLLGALAAHLGTQTDAVSKTQLAEIQDILRKARDQADPAVHAYAMYICALASPESEQAAALQRMLAPDENWRTRLLGLAAMDDIRMPAIQQKSVAQQVIDAKEEAKCVRDFAAATLKLLNQPPQTQPAIPGGGARPTPGK